MKKFFVSIIIGILVLSGLGASAIQKSQENVEIDFPAQGYTYRGTHTALGEYGTATWCGYCKYAHGALKELYAEGQLDFNYVALVCDKNSVAYSYAVSHFNLYGYPTLWWDGGYKVDIGAGSVAGAKSAYTSSITQCVARAVKNVDISLEVTWIGGTEMQVSCSIDNNEATTYSGTIRVYITEKVSSMGWLDTAGALYTHAFLDFAFDQAISIPAGDTWSDSVNWVGNSHGFPTITQSNTMVIAAVENDEWHQGYSYTPPNNPFNAYYVDDCVTVDIGAGLPPEKPTLTGPTSGLVGTEYEFEIVTIEPEDDDVSYYVNWDDGTNSGWKGPYGSGETITLTKTYNAIGSYDIKVKAKDSSGQESPWSDPLTINIIVGHSPTNPVISGPANAKIGISCDFEFKSTDPDSDELYYYIMWGDGNVSAWIGPYESGKSISQNHTWTTKGTYTIIAKAKDGNGLESKWGTFTVNIPRTKSVYKPLYTFLENHPVIMLMLKLVFRQL